MKIKSYLGFAYKSGNIVLGIDNIKRTKKIIYLILISNDLSENGANEIKKLAEDKNWILLCVHNLLNEIIVNKNVKIAGITDENLANVIIKEYNTRDK